MAAPTQSAEAGLKEGFFHQFQDEVKATRDRIESLRNTPVAGSERNEAMDKCLASIDRLSLDIKDASSYIPAYDQRTYSQAIKGLNDSLQAVRVSFNPPKRFAFKARKAAVSTTEDTSSSNPSEKSSRGEGPSFTTAPSMDKKICAAADPLESCVPISLAQGTGSRRPSFSHSTQITFSQLSNLHIVHPPSASRATNAGTLSHLTHCLVDLSAATISDTPLDALYLKDIKDSLIICGQVAGAIHITNMHNSVLVTSCRQFRMHGSKDVDVYLQASSRPIVEDCAALRFAPLPSLYSTIAMSQATNLWDKIDDFKWLKLEPSPNFSIIAVEKRLGDDVWNQVLKVKDNTLNSILTKVLSK